MQRFQPLQRMTQYAKEDKPTAAESAGPLRRLPARRAGDRGYRRFGLRHDDELADRDILSQALGIACYEADAHRPASMSTGGSG